MEEDEDREEEEYYSSEEEDTPYDPATPYVVDVVYDNRRQLPYNLSR